MPGRLVAALAGAFLEDQLAAVGLAGGPVDAGQASGPSGGVLGRTSAQHRGFGRMRFGKPVGPSQVLGSRIVGVAGTGRDGVMGPIGQQSVERPGRGGESFFRRDVTQGSQGRGDVPAARRRPACARLSASVLTTSGCGDARHSISRTRSSASTRAALK